MIHTNLIEVLDVIEKEKKIYEIFKNCPYQVLKKISMKTYSSGELIIIQGRSYDNMLFIVDGEAEIYVESEQGKKYSMATYEKFSFIGELELFNQKPYMSFVQAKGKTVILEIPRDKFLDWLEQDRKINFYFMSFLSNECYDSMLKMGENTLYTLKQRICQFLIENADGKGNLKRSLSAEMLSDRMGVTSRSVHRILKELKDKGIIEMHKSNVIIMDFEQLIMEKNEK